MGADVVKVERPEGDEARGWGPPFTLGGGPTFHAVNMNKRSIVLDLKDPQAIAWLKGYHRPGGRGRPESPPRRHRGAGARRRDVARAQSPTRVLLPVGLRRTAALGVSGPGYEPMVQAFAGLFSVNGGDEDPPSRFGAPVLDLGTGMWAAMGVLAALHQRARTGRGAVVDTSLFETALGWLSGHVAGYKFTGDLPLAGAHGLPAARALPGLSDEERHGDHRRRQRPPLREARERPSAIPSGRRTRASSPMPSAAPIAKS